MMSCPVRSSNPMTALLRAGGVVAGEAFVQLLPFQIQVSLSIEPLDAVPPNMTSWPVLPSNAIAAPLRAGGDVPGERRFHPVSGAVGPKVHVSLPTPPTVSDPPKVM